MPERDIDVVLLGATSVTGRQVAAYLDRRARETGLSWAAAARNADKLDRTLRDVGVTGATTISVDVTDEAALARLAERAVVVLNLVGPYTTWGRPVIDACVAGGAHYVDLSGEMPFVSRTTREVHEAALAGGVKVIQVCGFESLPPDLAVALAAAEAQHRYGEDLKSAEVALRTLRMPAGLPRPSDIVSGGTMQSLAQAVGEDDAVSMLDPACLIADSARAEEVRRSSPIGVSPRRSADGAVMAPMAPAAYINPAVIQRTAALADPPRPVPVYREGVALDGGALSLLPRLGAAGALSAVQVGARAVAGARSPIRKRASALLEKALPGSGFGPRADRLEDWLWSMDVSAATTSGQPVHVQVEGDGHPGYLTTSRMLGETGLLLAEPGATPDRAGCLTPALALGTDQLDRFAHAGLRFSSGSAG